MGWSVILVVPIPEFVWFRSGGGSVQLGDHESAFDRLHMRITEEDIGPLIVQIQRPLAFQIHADEPAPVRVAVPRQIPITVANRNHIGWLSN